MTAPPLAFFHNSVTNPYVHAALDVLTLAVATAPLWTAFLWGAQRRGLLLALVAVVQLPVAVIGFVPAVNPIVHVVTFVSALTLTALSLAAVRRTTRATEPAPTGSVG